jgi:hypothetical protein
MLKRTALAFLCTATVSAIAGTAIAPISALAADKPCQQIRQACLDAGFLEGAAKQGNGLVIDCVDPIMQGAAQPTKASKPLPTIDPQLVSACKTANPNFGSKQASGGQTAAPSAQPAAPPAAPPADSQGAAPAPAQ